MSAVCWILFPDSIPSGWCCQEGWQVSSPIIKNAGFSSDPHFPAAAWGTCWSTLTLIFCCSSMNHLSSQSLFVPVGRRLHQEGPRTKYLPWQITQQPRVYNPVWYSQTVECYVAVKLCLHLSQHREIPMIEYWAEYIRIQSNILAWAQFILNKYQKKKIIRHNVVKMAILLKLIYRVNALSIKIPADFSAEIDRLILKFMWKCKGPRTAKTILKKWKYNKVGGLTLLNSQLNTKLSY